MKKQLLFTGFIVLFCFFAFANAGEEEIDYLLFSPNSGDTFVDEEQAMVHLDNVAKVLINRNLSPGQVHIYGYVADVANDIDSESLSRERAVFVITELQKRGVPQSLFANPEGLGSVHLWDSNGDDRSFNRRVVITIDGTVLTPVEVEVEFVEPEVIVEEEVIVTIIEEEEESKGGFPWWLILLLLLLLAALLFLLSRLRKKASDKENVPVPAIVPFVEISETIVYLDDEIRYHAYMLHLERNGQSIDVEADWHQAVIVVGGRYEADGHEVYAADGSWWARKQTRKEKK